MTMSQLLKIWFDVMVIICQKEIALVYKLLHKNKSILKPLH